MRKALYTSILVLLALTIYAQEKVTISGKITVKDTGKPPIGIITVIEKGVVEYWSDETKEEIGTNRHTFVEKDGTFKFTIKKGGTIIIQDGYNRYMPRTLIKLDKTQTMDVVLSPTKRTNPPAYPANELLPHEKKVDIHKRIKISGRVTFPGGKGMRNATISQLEVYNEATPGPCAYTTSGKDGVYEYTVVKGGRVTIGSYDYIKQVFTPTKDTVINVKLKPYNPFN
ncbi:carboxypeptidase regulatory-like domain-containing protein [Myroides guanonis]|uniref:Carboxypeptidase regulatory-like domain-containing protein n=1 Tax=Myroides guanonis TaxID=1150112 RepID=A0A1I3PNP3_9FLAO|nr:carboxypeptidase regulatory-like domain-containing protein [Myroides guanonis]SFJ23168.1 hypothetical protein SAMN04487893_104192 [Myroides guanonis]